jgi:hypothetical protein
MPFENSHPLTKAMVENATLTAMKTPVGPKPRGCASAQASAISQSHRRTPIQCTGMYDRGMS